MTLLCVICFCAGLAVGVWLLAVWTSCRLRRELQEELREWRKVTEYRPPWRPHDD